MANAKEADDRDLEIRPMLSPPIVNPVNFQMPRFLDQAVFQVPSPLPSFECQSAVIVKMFYGESDIEGITQNLLLLQEPQDWVRLLKFIKKIEGVETGHDFV